MSPRTRVIVALVALAGALILLNGSGRNHWWALLFIPIPAVTLIAIACRRPK